MSWKVQLKGKKFTRGVQLHFEQAEERFNELEDRSIREAGKEEWKKMNKNGKTMGNYHPCQHTHYERFRSQTSNLTWHIKQVKKTKLKPKEEITKIEVR